MYLYLSENPRTLYLVTSQQDERQGRPRRALRFRAAESRSSQAIVEFLPKDEVNLSNAIKLTNRIVKGCLGLISASGDMFLAVIVSATEVGNTRPSGSYPENVSKIHEVGFFSLTSSTWDDLSVSYDSFGSSFPDDGMLREPYSQPNNSTPNLVEHPCSPLQKIIAAGTFYYAMEPYWDLSSRLSQRIERDEATAKDVGVYDERFVWNEYIVRGLLDFRDRLDPQERAELDHCQFIVLAIQGYVGVFKLALPAPPTNGSPTLATISLISRLGWKRAGTRFNTRGVDDDGNCANFVETEILFTSDLHCFSYVQVRGSVPLFWEQQGFQTFGQRIQLTRPQASQPAFERHFTQLTEEYGPIHAINLLGTKENEAVLSSAYDRALKHSPDLYPGNVGITHFDFHAAVKISGHEYVVRELRRQEGISDNVEKFSFTLADPHTNQVITQQRGTFRTNCLDWQVFLSVIRPFLVLNDQLGVLSDATKSVSRAYINNFQDKGKQIAIDMFLGNLSSQRQVTIFDPIHDLVNETLQKRISEYSTTKQCTIHVGTWNVNGRPPSSESLLPWLFPRSHIAEPDIIALGFQEIVPLTAQQIVQTDHDKRRMWETKILDVLSRRPNKESEYILLRSQQLVGTALLVFVKKELTSVMRNVEAATHKTGLRGMSGNKGAVGIRLDYHDSSFCFVTAHLAAGHSNIDERNADYHTIRSPFSMIEYQPLITAHRNVIWLADTNYRIDLDNETVRRHAEKDEYDALVAQDQLRDVMDARAAFSGYQEGPLLFRPTYKYDLGTDRYDTSEKLRIPAWTDRVLFKGGALDIAVYSRAELKGSDHRPVFAMFTTEIRIVDYAKRGALSRALFENVTSSLPGENLDEKLASITFSDGAPELPPPSSEDTAWWDTPEHPNGILSSQPSAEVPSQNHPYNPFDSDESPLSSSPSSSEEELYQALTLQVPISPQHVSPSPISSTRRPPPPPPPRSTKPAVKQTAQGSGS
ncbi:hypothetical protein NLI96_g9624 [Meripilus lineatus]|uniref:phosphoinositide 5-phosphatase n=1 Tax=Meripilus lineatus TaxID=2056292 RepID=A0AAD5YAT7_9APHY|nr:hypothetical protein NLI96_g9624 [Physisporinus lineatus]